VFSGGGGGGGVGGGGFLFCLGRKRKGGLGEKGAAASLFPFPLSSLSKGKRRNFRRGKVLFPLPPENARKAVIKALLLLSFFRRGRKGEKNSKEKEKIGENGHAIFSTFSYQAPTAT